MLETAQYIENVTASIEIILKKQLLKLGVHETNRSLIKEYCKRIVHPTYNMHETNYKIADYLFDDILLFTLQREGNGHTFLIPDKYSESCIKKIQNMQSL